MKLNADYTTVDVSQAGPSVYLELDESRSMLELSPHEARTIAEWLTGAANDADAVTQAEATE